MYRFRILIIGFLFLGIYQGIANNSTKLHLNSEGYIITISKNSSEIDEKWATYFYNHLKKRTNNPEKILFCKEHNSFLSFVIQVDNTLSNDYYLKNEKSKWLVKARSEEIMLWLVYQLISRIGEDNPSFEVSDLNPSIISLERNGVNFAFSYRDPHFYPNQNQEYNHINATNNVETDWGIWGHNLNKIVGNSVSSDVFAKVDGKVERSQFDFTSDELFKRIESYIINNFASQKSMRFVIMPNDNTIVSNTAKNIKLGNTNQNSTPSVSYMIERLAARFPKYTFFTSSYLTTKTPPARKLPNNTGVIISTMDIPKGIALNESNKTKLFFNDLQQWRNKTKEIYLWDYASNFDDYFTPFPILKGFQKQLKVFKKQGVTGVFINGSGYDFSTFQDVQTFVLGALLIDENLSIDDLVTRFYKRKYPISGQLLADYYLSLEKEVEQRGKSLNIYGSFKDAQRVFLDELKFVEFYDKISKILPKTKAEEYENLKKMYIALTFTRLQIAYFYPYKKLGFLQNANNKIEVNSYVHQLLKTLSQSSNYKDLTNYKEANGKIKDYINQWDILLARENFDNLLLGQKLSPKCELDEDYQDLTCLTNGVDGFPLDYHSGWVINSVDDLKVILPISSSKKAKKIAITFLQKEEKRFYLPKKIEIYKNNKLYKTITPNKDKNTDIVIVTDFVDFSDAQSIELRIYRNLSQKRNLLATSEIRLLP